MYSSRLQDILKSTDALSEHIRKRRAVVALNEFIDERINGTQQAIQPLTKDITLPSVIQVHQKEEEKIELKTEVTSLPKEENVIKTEEMCYVPFPFVQSETLLYSDGKRIITIFYPNNKKIPAKRIEYSADKNSIMTTTYDKEGNAKFTTTKTIFADGTRLEEKIDNKQSTKEIKKFNRMNIAIKIESYVNDLLSFEMICDNSGNIINEKTYYTFSKKSALKKEVAYNEKSYTTKEFTFDGKISSSQTTIVKK